MTVAILTVSDSATRGTREDVSGPLLRTRCEELGWEVADSAVVPDEAEPIVERLKEWSDNKRISLILTTGGTGVAARDITPEATRSIVEREIPGLGELMRAQGMQQTPFSALSRAIAGARGGTLIVNLPGSPKGALYSLGIIESLAPHAVRLLAGETEHEAAS